MTATAPGYHGLRMLQSWRFIAMLASAMVHQQDGPLDHDIYLAEF